MALSACAAAPARQINADFFKPGDRIVVNFGCTTNAMDTVVEAAETDVRLAQLRLETAMRYGLCRVFPHMSAIVVSTRKMVDSIGGHLQIIEYDVGGKKTLMTTIDAEVADLMKRRMVEQSSQQEDPGI